MNSHESHLSGHHRGNLESGISFNDERRPAGWSDFPWGELDRETAESAPGPSAAEAIRLLLEFFVSGGARPEVIAGRVLAVASDVLQDLRQQPKTKIGAAAGFSKQRFALFLRKAKKRFGDLGPVCRTPEQRDRMAEKMRESHRRRKTARPDEKASRATITRTAGGHRS